jgi:hypothetical protein
MKSSYKLALLAALGLASVTAAHAQAYNDGSSTQPGDLIVGVYQPGATSTEVIDLGAFTSLVNGQTWNLSSGLSTAGITLSSTGFFGVVGDFSNPSGADSVYSTLANGTPSKINGNSAFSSIDSGFSTIAIGPESIGSQNLSGGNDWKTSADPTVSGTAAASLGYSPDVAVTSGAKLWTINDDNSAPTLDGTFTLNTTSDVLTFNAVAVPEPTTYGLVAGAGLLIVSLRGKFSRKQA